ncbi:PREDICTED: uncharacterized protein LOC106741803 [Dinoponera quadriceps]|uniref:Uncharacterized protein LOC106741803 n=1 Tax=Dinoponera quadriceps TaxID=609295 RepID=A0A6P3WU27_DINQU|nr:PREDICTED: uncharacterized protein LOC106741803 [Dinoponera quadriceps]XP_014469636.1 PREDICTED: uncharacterized protein LOC106741803 [Dinoponera quadriceps]
MEYTLQDALGTLKDKKDEQEKNIEELTNIMSNNEVQALQASISNEDLQKKRLRILQSLMTEIQQLQLQDFPVLRTNDMHTEVVKDMENEIQNMHEMLKIFEKTLLDIQEDIKYLKNKKSGLDKMREAYVGFTETFADRTYKNEQILTKRIFQSVKDDLYSVVDTIFPKNDEFKEFLATLTSAYMKGGDDVYVKVRPEILDCVNFLLEADIAQQHRNDKTQVRMTELL